MPTLTCSSINSLQFYFCFCLCCSPLAFFYFTLLFPTTGLVGWYSTCRWFCRGWTPFLLTQLNVEILDVHHIFYRAAPEFMSSWLIVQGLLQIQEGKARSSFHNTFVLCPIKCRFFQRKYQILQIFQVNIFSV